jgi:hypothetical protein
VPERKHADRQIAWSDKYRVVASLLDGASGTVLDVGARDRRLGTLLNSSLAYASADIGPGHDYVLDLEGPLPLSDHKFDFVVALDVLEHLEAIHSAFDELARITSRTLFIALPNMATARRRLLFLLRGNLGTGKYDLRLEHQGDRHRWLTVYDQMNSFIQQRAGQNGLTLRSIIEELDTGTGRFVDRGMGLIGRGLVGVGVFSPGLIAGRCIYVLDRDPLK